MAASTLTELSVEEKGDIIGKIMETFNVNGNSYIRDTNKISIQFKNGIIKAHTIANLKTGKSYTLLVTDGDYIFAPESVIGGVKYYPSKTFSKAVKSGEFRCAFTLLNNSRFLIQ